MKILRVERSTALSRGIVADLNGSKSVGHSLRIIHMDTVSLAKCRPSEAIVSSSIPRHEKQHP